MDHSYIEILGFVAAFLTTVSFFPQAWQTIKTKDTSGISKMMYILFTTGILLWLIYGLLIKSYPLIIGNAITLTLAGTILFYKLNEGNSSNT